MLIILPAVFVTVTVQSLLWLDKKKTEKYATRSDVQSTDRSSFEIEANGHGLKDSGVSDVKEIKEELK